jgi:hypothetical protein
MGQIFLNRFCKVTKVVGVFVLVLASIEGVAFIARIHGSGWTTYQERKRSQTLGNLYRVGLELVDIQQREGRLPNTLVGLKSRTTDGWGDRLQYWTDGTDYVLSSLPVPGGSSSVHEESSQAMPKLEIPEGGIQTDPLDLRPESISVGGRGEIAKRFGGGPILIKYPLGSNGLPPAAEGSIARKIGTWVFQFEQKLSTW